MQRLFLDCNIYDALARDGETAALVRTALDGGLVKVIVNSVVKNELAASPFNGVPEIFAVELVSDHVAYRALLARTYVVRVKELYSGSISVTPIMEQMQ